MRIYRQAALTGLMILLTVLILFAMTSAWYTNVVQTSGLTFEAESWGFEGNITLEEGVILAAPGDDGIIDLAVENKSDSVSAISVNVSKTTMADEMKQRLFFYVDTRMSRNGETMERVYLNRFEGYTYNVFNNSSLTLTEEFSNAPVIKWEWVYDVLGYYVIGKPYEVTVSSETQNEDGTTTLTETTIQEMNIEEYLRPIIYDFDEATTLINTEGESITVELDTINGVHTPVEFLAELSQVDGYDGVIDTKATPAFGNYYAVDVDEDGYGVYAYLCNYSEIQKAISYDTDLGELAYKQANSETLTEAEKEKLQHTATIMLSAQKDDNTVITIGTPVALQEAIAAGVADVIQLTGNITLGEGTTLLIPENRRVMVDLNEHTLTSTDDAAITALPGSSLTLTNGTLQQADQSSETDPATTYGIKATGAEVVMSDMEIYDFQHGIYVGDNADDNELDSRVHIMNSTIAVENCAAFISGNGLASEQKSRLIIENSTLSSHNIVVAGNGSTSGNGRWGTDIQIINSNIIGTSKDDTSANGVGIYQPQKNSTLTVLDSHVEGSTGIALKGGSTKIGGNSTIIGNGAYEEPSFDGSGFTNTGDAVYIETNYGYEIQLLICDNSSLEHESDGSLSLRVYEEDTTNVLVEIEAGTFEEEQPDTYLAEGSVQGLTEVQEGVSCYVVTAPEQTDEEVEEQTDDVTGEETSNATGGETGEVAGEQTSEATGE